MDNKKPKGTFAKLMSSALPLKPEHTTADEEKPVNSEKNSSKPAFQNSSIPVNWKARMLANQQTGVTNTLRNKTSTEKVTYRFHAEGKYAVEDMKTILARKHGIKASLEEIAEECILLAYDDLLENQNSSKLASRLARKPANQNS